MVIEMMNIVLGTFAPIISWKDTRNLPLLIHCNSGKVIPCAFAYA